MTMIPTRLPRPGVRSCLAVLLLVCLPALARAADPPAVTVEILEGLADKKSWDVSKATVTATYTAPAFAFTVVPTKYSDKALALDRSSPYLLRATATLELPAGDYRLIVRSRNAARLYVDDKKLAENPFLKPAPNGHEHMPKMPPPVAEGIKPLEMAQKDRLIKLTLDGKPHTFRFEAVVGGQDRRPEVGNPALAIAAGDGEFYLLSPGEKVRFDPDGWHAYAEAAYRRHIVREAETRRRVGQAEAEYWQRRHDIVRGIIKDRTAPEVPAVAATTPVQNAIDRFLGAKLEREKVAPTSLVDDDAFLRRVTLDAIGLIPSPEEIAAFREDKSADRRARVIDRLLADPRWADHWVGYWQDVLAENPGLITPSLNNTGPFRWYLYNAFYDNLPADRFASELVMMEGSLKQGAPAAFGMASNNDSPMAAKAHVLGKAFLGVDMTCARCHDAPYHPWKQQQLFGMGALLNRAALKIPGTSTVPLAKGARKPAVEVTLKAGASVAPAWLFQDLADAELPAGIVRDDRDQRERLAALITSPDNARFAQVMVNRLWQRYMGLGLVRNLDDWHNQEPSHPELLDWLARELMLHGYDLKHVARLILTAHAYQRQAVPLTQLEENRLFAGPARRRLTAEQLIDSLFAAVGKEFDSEELTFDPEARMAARQCENLGRPRRAWHFGTLANERDRPALSLPIAQGYIDLLEAFGWRASRPMPQTQRDDVITPVQAMTLANGQLMNRLVRLTDDAELTELCLQQQELPDLVQAIYRRVLSRSATAAEVQTAVELLRDGYEQRLTGKAPLPRQDLGWGVSWSNHLSPEATRSKVDFERTVRAGPTPTPRLKSDWRTRAEDFIWGLLNSPEFVYVP